MKYKVILLYFLFFFLKERSDLSHVAVAKVMFHESALKLTWYLIVSEAYNILLIVYNKTHYHVWVLAVDLVSKVRSVKTEKWDLFADYFSIRTKEAMLILQSGIYILLFDISTYSWLGPLLGSDLFTCNVGPCFQNCIFQLNSGETFSPFAFRSDIRQK